VSLKSLTFVPILNTSDSDIIADFFVPALANAVQYDRGVGFFSAGWLRITASGMVPFAVHGGRARWVTSPVLGAEDWQALQTGEAARQDALLHQAITRNIDQLAQTLQEDTLSALAWLVADEILDFKLALPRNKLDGGEFHDKFGIFTDSNGDRVSFNGSYNESIQGTRNYESIKIFCSWQEAFAPLVTADTQRFEKLWNNFDPNVQVFNLSDAARAQILKLRTQERPYPEPRWVKARLLRERAVTLYSPICLRLPATLILRDYQVSAVDAWLQQGGQGLLEMATGTGKTIASLAAGVGIREREQRLALIIAAPYQHLVDQWREIAEAFGAQPILAYQKKSQWLKILHQQALEYNRGDRQDLAVITTHTTFIDADFQKIIANLVGPALLIADEAHHLGAERTRVHLPATIPYRLALSATPDRWFDEAGTTALRDYFGETVFRFTLEEAIQQNILTPYTYHPVLVELTPAELEEYEALSVRIARLISSEKAEYQEALEMLLIKRAQLLNNAEEKLRALSRLISQISHISHALFYCSPDQIDAVSQLLGWDHGLMLGRFTAEEPNAVRQQILADFDSQVLQGLVAMKCLDEGVDVPSTKLAFILASSSNPREFIQRRGRILRRAPGKSEAIIYDFITIPPQSWSSGTSFTIERSIVERELKRFREFATSARNKHQALDVIWQIAQRYNIYEV
jgi:superfamily II DNA or RNA helicase